MSRVSEPAREAFLYQIWKKNSILDKQLYTIGRKKIFIRERGIQNYDAGPDFINSLIEIDDALVRGDVEIHPVAGDWYAHGHHRDPRYNQVVLHVVTMNCPADFKTVRQDGVLVPTINLDTFLDQPAETMEKEHEGPILPDVGSCALAGCPASQVRRVLEKTGKDRFIMHANQFREQRSQYDWDQLVFQALCESLGYSKNQVPFRNLAQRLTIDRLWEYIWNDSEALAVLKCEAFLFGAAGLLPSQAVNKEVITDPDTLGYVQQLESLWLDFPYRAKITPLKPEAWKFFRLRPQNFPTRRIAAAAQLVVRFMDDGFLSPFLRIIVDREQNTRMTVSEMENLLRFDSTGYWLQHFQFNENTGSLNRHKLLIGNSRIRDMLVNVIMPALYAWSMESGDHRGANAVLELYFQFPALSDNQVTRRMQSILENALIKRKPDNVRLQQGLIQLNKFYCKDGECNSCMSLLLTDQGR